MAIYSLHKLSARHHSVGTNTPRALREISLSIGAGEQVAVIGSSGAGKTTLLHTLACAHQPDSGSLTLFDADPWQLSQAARHALRARLFLAPQTPPLPPRQRVVNAVLAGCLPRWNLWQAIASLIKPVETRTAYEALAQFELQDKLFSRVDRLSGGERQRCGLARLLVSHAEIFLVDEPLSALDLTLSLVTLNALQNEATARNATLICSLHHVDFARAYFPRIIGLREGRIEFDLAREAVTDDMISRLYQNEQDRRTELANAPHETSPAALNPPYL